MSQEIDVLDLATGSGVSAHTMYARESYLSVAKWAAPDRCSSLMGPWTRVILSFSKPAEGIDAR